MAATAARSATAVHTAAVPRRAPRPAAPAAAAAVPRRQQRRALRVSATAAPPATASPFAAVQNEEQLFRLLKAGASKGTVRSQRGGGLARAVGTERALFDQGRAPARLTPPCRAPSPPHQVPPSIIAAFDELYGNYKAAVLQGASPGASPDFVAKVMASVGAWHMAARGAAARGMPGVGMLCAGTATAEQWGLQTAPTDCSDEGCVAAIESTPPPRPQVCERVLLELSPATSYTFPSYHASIKEPYNYFLFGQRYIRWAGAGRRAAARWAAPYMGAAASEEAAAGQRQAQPFRRRACAAPPSVFPCVLGSGSDRLQEQRAGPRRHV